MTTNNVSFNIRMDRNLKNELDSICNELGMSISTAMTIFAKAVVRKGGIPFSVSLDTPNADTLAAIAEAEVMKKNPSVGKTYNSVDEMFKDVLK